MITKITQIVSLSRFKHFSSSDSKIELAKTTMFFAPNGRGKTSVADMLRSMIANNPLLLDKRNSKVYPGSPAVTITHSTPMNTSRYASGVWTNTPKDLTCLTFDKDFIQQNIHTVTVDHEHKKKLHGLIVGEGAIEARESVKNHRDAQLELQKKRSAMAKTFQALGTKNITLEEFVKLVEGDVDTLEGEKTLLNSQLEALGSPEVINALPVISKIVGVEIDLDSLRVACSSTIEGGSKESVELITRHSNEHIAGSTEEAKEFLASGVKALKSDQPSNCALCGQLIGEEAKSLVDALFAIFSAQYLNLRTQINAKITLINDLKLSEIVTKLESANELNISRHIGWTKYDKGLPAIYELADMTSIKSAYVTSKNALVICLKAKLDDMSLVITKELQAYKDALGALTTQVISYNNRVDEINLAITEYKKTLDIGKKKLVLEQLNEVENNLVRSSAIGKEFCTEYAEVEKSFKSADIAYRKALSDFATAQESIIAEHGKLINEILAYCGAKFRLDGMVQGTRLGSTEPYIEYAIKLEGGMQDSQSTASEAIGDILSDGEKNLLAFAFFWSLIKHSDLSATIAIFDDPLSSIDQAWRLQLIDKLKELCDSGLLQLFVFTHYEDFARTVALRIPGIKQVTIEAGGPSVGNNLAPFDIEAVTKELQFSRIEKLRDYIADPTTSRPEDVQREIRTILEAALKYKYYLKLLPLIDSKKWLRDFIEDPALKLLLQANQTYSTLDTLCVNGGWANHDNPPSQIFTQDQALAYAQQTLDVLEKL